MLVLLSAHFGNRKLKLCPSCMPLFLSVCILLLLLCFCPPSRHVVIYFKHFRSKVLGVLPISHFLPISFPNSLFLLTSAFQAYLTYLLRFFAVSTGVSNTKPTISFYRALSPILIQLVTESNPALFLTDAVRELPSVTGSNRLPPLEGNARHMSAETDWKKAKI